MSENRRDADDPNLLIEAARVFNAAGPQYRRLAKAALEWALQSKQKAAPEVQAAIIGDAAAMQLSGRLRGGYREALGLLETANDAVDTDGRLHLLRAVARGEQYKEEHKRTGSGADAEATPDTGQLKTSIMDDLKFAFAKNKNWREEYEKFWSSGGTSGINDETRDQIDVDINAKIKGWADQV
jgi:hypothetical protein